MDKELIFQIKNKREFSGLPDSLIEKTLEFKQIKNKPSDEKVKLSREFLRKYFGIFMTNKVVKGKDEKILESHISSKKRDYNLLYAKINSVTRKYFESILDFGCGVNGFSYQFIKKYFGSVNYTGIEATKQLCDSQNIFFNKNNLLDAKIIWGDLFDLPSINEIIKKTHSPRLIFLFQVIDALENLEPNFSKIFLTNLRSQLNQDDAIVVSNPTKSISGRNDFKIKRRWLEEFLDNDFKIIEKFYLFDEEFFVFEKLPQK